MSKILSSVLICMGLAFTLTILMAHPVFAQDARAFQEITKKAVDIFRQVRTIIFIVGGFGLMVLAVAAIFGTMSWEKFAYLGIGLTILALAGAIVEWFAGEDPGLEDTI